METKSLSRIEQALHFNTTCDAWGKDATCDNAPDWQVQVRHAKPSPADCPPITFLLCNQCRMKMHRALAPIHGGIMRCSDCGGRNLVVPDDFILSEVPYVR